MDREINNSIFTAMQVGEPYKTYKKTILGKVAVSIFNQFSQKPETVFLSGDPRKNDEDCFVDVWSEMEDVFFKKMNKAHISSGRVIQTNRPKAAMPTEEELLNTMSDEKLNEVINYQWYKFKSILNNITSADTVHRLLLAAKDADKSDKFIKAIEARISELEYGE